MLYKSHALKLETLQQLRHARCFLSAVSEVNIASEMRNGDDGITQRCFQTYIKGMKHPAKSLRYVCTLIYYGPELKRLQKNIPIERVRRKWSI
jgi:hypothetical protein